MQRKKVNGMLEKFHFLWTLLREGKPLNKFESDVYPLPDCGYRWCKNGNCSQCDVEIWSAFITFVKLLTKPPNAKQLAKGEKKSSLVLK